MAGVRPVNASIALYSEALQATGDVSSRPVARLRDGSVRPLLIDRWVGPADAVDERALADIGGPVLDVGCGPGRHLHALARRGVLGFGVDLSSVAVDLARGGGVSAIVGSIFAEVPHAGRWRSALLLDGNIGIGGNPVRLLSRVAELLTPGGEVLVELAAPAAHTIETMARLEISGTVSDWFPWAEVSAGAIAELSARAGLEAGEAWGDCGRWFARLRRRAGTAAGQRAGGGPERACPGASAPGGRPAMGDHEGPVGPLHDDRALTGHCRQAARVAVVSDACPGREGQLDGPVGVLGGALGQGQLVAGDRFDGAAVDGDGGEAVLGPDDQVGVYGAAQQAPRGQPTGPGVVAGVGGAGCGGAGGGDRAGACAEGGAGQPDGPEPQVSVNGSVHGDDLHSRSPTAGEPKVSCG
jgi:SAM-dependent methyltransferase